MIENLPIKIAPQKPSLWIERVVLFSKDNPWTVLQDFKFTRGVNVVLGKSSGSEQDAARGHSVGKTTLFRLIRFALGEENYGTKEDEAQIQGDFARGHVGMTLHIDGGRWSVVRCFGVTGAELAGQNQNVENLIATSEQTETYDNFLCAIGAAFVKKWPFQYPPKSDRVFEWAHLLGWMARDQEARHRAFHIWRDKSSAAEMNAFLHAEQDPLYFVRMILGCVSRSEFDVEEKIGMVEKDIEELRTARQQQGLESAARRLNLENLIGAYIPQEKRQGIVNFIALRDIGCPPASGQCNTGRWLAGKSFPRVKARALWHRAAGISSVGRAGTAA